MIRSIFTYGLASGAVIILGMLAAMKLEGGHGSVLTGYLIMLVALSVILIGVKQHRDRELGGVIKFTTAFLLGLGIALAASFAYVAVWEAYLATTHYTFMTDYTDSMLAAKRAAGVTGAAYAKAVAQAEEMRRQYANPLYRLPETFIEIFPVGLLVALVSAGLLRNPRFLPSRSRPA
jgi:hypothetical protein